MGVFDTICCAIDFSGASENALRVAAELARRLDAKLVLLHVREPRLLPAGAVLAPPEFFSDAVVRDAEEMATWTTIAEEARGAKVRAVTVEGPAPVSICRFARECRADLIVVGTHGRAAVSRMVLGSVAEQVARKAHCPVLFVREQQKVEVRSPAHP